MKRWFAVLALLSWGLAAPAAVLYDQLAPALDQVQTLQGKNPVQALSVLSDAENRFREGATDLTPVLREGVLQSLADAKQALSKKSATDLSARVQFIKAILGKALYDTYFNDLSGGKTQEATALLPKVLAASGLPASLSTQASALAAANNLDGLRRFFERTYAQGIVNALGRAQAQTSPPQAYLEATRAYALYLVVQDSPKARSLNAKAFVDALGKLSSGNLGGFKDDAKTLSAQAQNFLKSVSTPQTQTRSTAPRAAANPPISGGVRLQAPLAPPAPKKSLLSSSSKLSLVLPVKAQPAPKALEAVTSINSLPSDLRPLIKDPKKAQAVVTRLEAAGISSLEEWRRALLGLQGSLLEAQVQSADGQTEAAQAALGQIAGRYRTAIQPLVEALNPALAARTANLLDRAASGGGLRATDFSVLGGELLENSLSLQGRSLGSFHSFQVGLLGAVLGIPRAFLFILACILSVLPLYLLGLTFGGRNLYWRYLGLAFFFLLLPAMMEGLSYLGSMLGGVVPALAGLVNLSAGQNLVAQLVWGLTLLLAVAFSILGLRGIAAQFGLLPGGAAREVQPRNSTLPGQTAKAAKLNPGLSGETIVEWDEEF